MNLQLLQPGKYMWLLTALYGLLMLLPQVSPSDMHAVDFVYQVKTDIP